MGRPRCVPAIRRMPSARIVVCATGAQVYARAVTTLTPLTVRGARATRSTTGVTAGLQQPRSQRAPAKYHAAPMVFARDHLRTDVRARLAGLAGIARSVRANFTRHTLTSQSSMAR